MAFCVKYEQVHHEFCMKFSEDGFAIPPSKQQFAIALVAHQEHFSHRQVFRQPPGTGKTGVILELYLPAQLQNPKGKAIVRFPTNTLLK